MSDELLPVTLAGETLLLHPERAVLWPAQRTAFIADLHLGKDEIFRRAGIPIPQGATHTDLQRLHGIVDGHGIERIVLLGDFLHGASAETPSHTAQFMQWRAVHAAVEFIVVAGNHDRRASRRELADAVRWCEEDLFMGPFVCRHHPRAADRGYALCGHMHPMLRLKGSHREKARIPVCWVRRNYAILPSFGTFTGGADIAPEEGDAVFAFAAGKVWSVCSSPVPR